MKNEYYKLPLDCKKFFENGGQFEKCTEQESIDQHIELLLTTYPGEHRFDANYGCQIWELDFENIASPEQWREQFREFVYNSISRYEKRITDIELDIELKEIVKEDRSSYSVTVRKRADIYVRARMLSNDEMIRLGYSLYLGPLSSE